MMPLAVPRSALSVLALALCCMMTAAAAAPARFRQPAASSRFSSATAVPLEDGHQATEEEQLDLQMQRMRVVTERCLAAVNKIKAAESEANRSSYAATEMKEQMEELGAPEALVESIGEFSDAGYAAYLDAWNAARKANSYNSTCTYKLFLANHYLGLRRLNLRNIADYIKQNEDTAQKAEKDAQTVEEAKEAVRVAHEQAEKIFSAFMATAKSAEGESAVAPLSAGREGTVAVKPPAAKVEGALAPQAPAPNVAAPAAPVAQQDVPVPDSVADAPVSEHLNGSVVKKANDPVTLPTQDPGDARSAVPETEAPLRRQQPEHPAAPKDAVTAPRSPSRSTVPADDAAAVKVVASGSANKSAVAEAHNPPNVSAGTPPEHAATSPATDVVDTAEQQDPSGVAAHGATANHVGAGTNTTADAPKGVASVEPADDTEKTTSHSSAPSGSSATDAAKPPPASVASPSQNHGNSSTSSSAATDGDDGAPTDSFASTTTTMPPTHGLLTNISAFLHNADGSGTRGAALEPLLLLLLTAALALAAVC